MNVLTTLLAAARAVGPITAALPEFRALYDVGVSVLHPDQQLTAKDALDDLIADNAEGYARLDAKLTEAAMQRH